MFPRVAQVAPVATLLAIGMPEPDAMAMSAPTLEADEAVMLVRRGGRGGHHGGFRHDDDHHRHHFHFRDRPHFGLWFGFGAPYYYGYRYDDDCRWLRRRAIVTDSRYWWRRYRACRHGW